MRDECQSNMKPERWKQIEQLYFEARREQVLSGRGRIIRLVPLISAMPGYLKCVHQSLGAQAFCLPCIVRWPFASARLEPALPGMRLQVRSRPLAHWLLGRAAGAAA